MNAYPDTRWVGMRFSFEFVDQRSREDATPTSSTQAAGSKIANTLDEVNSHTDAYIYLEHNRWGLNRTFVPLPTSHSTLQTGWIGSYMSKADCTFATNPYLEFGFEEEHSSIGFTLRFEEVTGQHPTRILTQTFDADGEIISQVESENHSANFAVGLLSPEYRRVRFTFLETSRPYSRVCVAEVLFGIIETFKTDSIVNATLEYAVDPVADSLPTSEVVFRIDNSDQRFKLSSSIGFKGIFRKVLIFVMVGIAHILDAQVIGNGSVLRTAVIFFYISNEGVSLLENASHLGLPVPEAVKAVLKQLHNRAEEEQK